MLRDNGLIGGRRELNQRCYAVATPTIHVPRLAPVLFLKFIVALSDGDLIK